MLYLRYKSQGPFLRQTSPPSMAKETSLHVLLVTLPAQGNINPLLRFGEKLLPKGLRVTLAATGSARERLLAANKTSIHFEFFSDGFDSSPSPLPDRYMETLEKVGPHNLSDLLISLSNNGRSVSCIVSSPFIPWVIDVAQEHGIPCGVLWVQPCSLYVLYFHYYLNAKQFPDLTEEGTTTIELPGLPLLTKEDLPSFFFPSNTFKSMSKIMIKLFENMKKVRWVFANSFYELESEAIESIKNMQTIKPVGPLVPSKQENSDSGGSDKWKEEEGCLDWLNTKPERSVVYVSFGSVIVLSKKQMENLAWGLRDSGRPFLWGVNSPKNEAGDGGELPEGFLEETAGQGMVVRWCSQVKVLSHGSIACFLTHCGWNSSLEAIAAGVPVIAFPQWTDQPTNAKLLVDVFGMGLRMRKEGDEGMVSKEEVERCVFEVTEGARSEELKKKALEWKMVAEAAAMEGGTSDKNISEFVNEIVGEVCG